VTVPPTIVLSQALAYEKLLALLTTFKFEEYVKVSKYYNVLPAVEDVDKIICNLIEHEQKEPGVLTTPSRRFELRIKALERLRDSGCDPEKIIAETILPEGYNGKILLVMIMGGILGRMVCLRSGDMWHREILRNTESEIRELGFFDGAVYELGGAHVRFGKHNDIVIFGTSDDFGSCDKMYASKLIQRIYENRDVIILN